MKVSNLEFSIDLGRTSVTRDGFFLYTYGNSAINAYLDPNGNYEITGIRVNHQYRDEYNYQALKNFDTLANSLLENSGIEFEFGSPILSLIWECDYQLRFYVQYKDLSQGGAEFESYAGSWMNDSDSPNNISPRRGEIQVSDLTPNLPQPFVCGIIDNFTVPFSNDVEHWHWFFHYATEPGGEPILFFEKHTFFRDDMEPVNINGQWIDFYEGHQPNGDANVINALVIPANAKEIHVTVMGHNRRHGWSSAPGTKTIPVETIEKPYLQEPSANWNGDDIVASTNIVRNGCDITDWGIEIAEDPEFVFGRDAFHAIPITGNVCNATFVNRNTSKKQYVRTFIKWRHVHTYITNRELRSDYKIVPAETIGGRSIKEVY